MQEKKLNSTLSLTADEMRHYGYKVVDLLVNHFVHLPNKKPVAINSKSQSGDILGESPPSHGTNPEDVLQFVMKNVLSNGDFLQHQKFYSYCPSPSNFISTMADSLATGFNVFSGAWVTSPGATNVEVVCVNWLLEMFGLPIKEGGGLFTSGGSMANMTGIVTARDVKCGDSTAIGVLYISDQAHSSVPKAAKVIGLKDHQIVVIPTNSDYTMNVVSLMLAIKRDKIDGRLPFCVVATAGTTNTGAVDSLDLIAEVCADNDLWFHVDAAYGGAAILSDKKHKFKGIEFADSIAVDPHKWLFQPYEIGCLLIREHKLLASVFSVSPDYLRDISVNTGEINFSNRGIQLTRQFRALKFYMSIKTFGLDSFRSAINSGISLAESVEEYLENRLSWEIMSKAELAVINFRVNPFELNFEERELDDLNQYVSKK